MRIFGIIADFFSTNTTTTWHMPVIAIPDIIEMLIIAVLLYKLMAWMRDTRAWALFKGLIFVLVFYGLAALFDMQTIVWLAGKAFTYGLIAFFVVFQPELRGLLERLGGKGASLSTPKVAHKERLIIEIVKALSAASDSKTGVLIVVEGKTGLKNFIDTGIAINAAVSSELLGNIFFKNAPLHDGAVILSGNRIAAAGCIIPLTDTVDLDPSYGTRHRAAIGISEVSDGLSLVVSEETGLISAAISGTFMAHLTLEEVETLLRDFYSNNRRRKKKGKRRSR